MSLPEPISGLQRPQEGYAQDKFGRVHTYLRLSVTDRCNYRCTYCMPEDGLKWMDKDRLLRFEELQRIVKLMVGMGVERVRLTGGEPLIRKDLVELVAMLSSIEGLTDLSMTTNGHLLEAKADALARAGLNRVNVSLDSVDAQQFHRLTRGGDLARVLRGIHAAREAGLGPIKVNAVMLAGENEAQMEALIHHFAPHASNTHIRFIEAMPFGHNSKKEHLSAETMRERLSQRYTLRPITEPQGGGPAVMWMLEELGLKVGFIAPMSGHFCQACNRLRLMADGSLRTCLSKDTAPGLRTLIRAGVSDEALELAIRRQIWHKTAGHEAHRLRDWKPFEGVMTRIGG